MILSFLINSLILKIVKYKYKVCLVPNLQKNISKLQVYSPYIGSSILLALGGKLPKSGSVCLFKA